MVGGAHPTAYGLDPSGRMFLSDIVRRSRLRG